MKEKIPAPEPGVYENVPFEEYLKWDCFSKSMTDAALKSGKHLQKYLRDGISSSSISFGSLADTMILEPENFSKEFIIQPETYPDKNGVEKPWSNKSSVCRDYAATIKRGREIVSPDQIEAVEAIKENIAASSVATHLLRGKKQVSIVYVDPDTNVTCKVRFDVLNDDGDDSLVDLKTTKDASFAAFRNSALNFNYHVQASMYQKAYELIVGDLLPFYFVVAESVDPYCVATYCMREDSIAAGAELARRAQLIYRYCMEHGYEGYADEVVDLDIPMYAITRVLDEGEAV